MVHLEDGYYNFNPEMLSTLYRIMIPPNYPRRVTPPKWPDTKLIGKAMVKGWAVPCVYYGETPRGIERKWTFFVFPGLPGGSAFEAMACVLLESLLISQHKEKWS